MLIVFCYLDIQDILNLRLTSKFGKKMVSK